MDKYHVLVSCNGIRQACGYVPGPCCTESDIRAGIAQSAKLAYTMMVKYGDQERLPFEMINNGRLGFDCNGITVEEKLLEIEAVIRQAGWTMEEYDKERDKRIAEQQL